MSEEPKKSNPALIIAIIGLVGTICAASITVIGPVMNTIAQGSTELTKIAAEATARQDGIAPTIPQSISPASTQTPYPTYTPIPTNVPPTVTIPPPPTSIRYNLIGSWDIVDSADCTVVIYKDNGTNIEGNCDNTVIEHKIVGTYSDSSHITITISRSDLSSGCETSTNGYITIKDNNNLTIGQEGWHGCGVNTGSITQDLTRQ